MNILLLEDDSLIADLVEMVLTNSVAGARVTHATSVGQAKTAWSRQPAQLVLCDWNLPDGTGLELVKFIRSTDTVTPIVMISASSDRQHVMAAARYGISDFIAKPFDVAMLQQRLMPLLLADLSAGHEPSALPSLNDWLNEALTDQLRLPTELDQNAVLPLLADSDNLSPTDLAQSWKNHPALTARLLKQANGASLKRSGKPVSQLDEAIATLGVDLSLRNAMALALDVTGSLHDERLIERARHYQTTAEQVATIARAMALSIGLNGLNCYTAGLLSRSGELAVLRVLQDFITRGGSLDDAAPEQLLAQWAPNYGNRLKQQWGLPLPIRELIGAIHMVPAHATQRTLLIMHLAGLRVASRLHGRDATRMLRQAGLEPEKWLAEAPEQNQPSRQG